MENKAYKAPIQVYFLWHSVDDAIALPIVEHVYRHISRNVDDPYERFTGIPVFCRVIGKDDIKDLDYTRAEKTILFPFFTTSSVSDDKWDEYIAEIINSRNDGNIFVVPLANSDEVNSYFDRFEDINVIHLSNDENREENYTEIYHRIVSILLSSGKKLNVFISHTKSDDSAQKLAEEVCSYIGTNTTLGKFFDVNDIPKGRSIGKEIDDSIDENAAFLIICSESYESRYWCQHEILTAKKQHCPILSVNIESNIIPRRFPFLSNIPSVRLDLVKGKGIDVSMLTCIMNLMLIESIKIRFMVKVYKLYEEIGIIPATAKKLIRAPEPADVCEIMQKNEKTKGKLDVYYPEPLIYSEELSIYEDGNINIMTPLSSFGRLKCNEYKIGISISDPQKEYLQIAGILRQHIDSLAQDIGRYCLAAGMELIYGGDFREKGITEFLTQEAYSWNNKIGMKGKNIRLHNYVAWPIYNKELEKIKSFESKYINVLKIIRCPMSENGCKLGYDKDTYFEADNAEKNYLWCCSLSEMRKKIVNGSDMRVCAGGKVTGYKGRMPGVAEEILLTLREKKPLFLIGGFGGLVSLLCRQLLANDTDNDAVEELTLDWQTNNSDLYRSTYKYAKGKGDDFAENYKQLAELLSFDNLNNGLTIEENKRLFETQFVDEVMLLIFRGINNLNDA